MEKRRWLFPVIIADRPRIVSRALECLEEEVTPVIVVGDGSSDKGKSAHWKLLRNERNH